MLSPSLAYKLRRKADHDAIVNTATSTFSGLFTRFAEALEDAGVDGDTAEVLANDVVSGILSSLSGAADAMVGSVVASAEAMRSSPRH